MGNDACWTQIEREQVLILGKSIGYTAERPVVEWILWCVLGDNVACPLLYTPYSGIAERYGGQGYDLTGPKDKVTEVLQEAQNKSRGGVATLVNAMIGSTSFREGSLSV